MINILDISVTNKRHVGLKEKNKINITRNDENKTQDLGRKDDSTMESFSGFAMSL